MNTWDENQSLRNIILTALSCIYFYRFVILLYKIDATDKYIVVLVNILSVYFLISVADIT